jgi:hypothetical protein
MHRTTATLAVLVLLATSGLAQPATPTQREGAPNEPGFGTMHFQTHLGSYKIIDGHGRVEMDFTGTVLIDALKGDYKFTGTVRKELEKYGRVLYNGKGHLVITGTWRALQWFGRDMQGVWYGKGVMRVSGEFDRDQKTGEFWFEDPDKIMYWPGGSSIDVPMPTQIQGYNPNVKVIKKGGKG